MSIFINSKQRRDEYNQITQLQNQINQFLTDPNIDDAVKSEARKQLNELSTNISQQNMRKGVARQYTIDTLNSIVQSLTPAEEGYQPSYITPSEGFKYIEQFDPTYTTDTYKIVGTSQNLLEKVNKFSNFLIQELSRAKGILGDKSKVLYGWKDANTLNTIDTWINELSKNVSDEQSAKNKLGYIGNTIINALANEKLAEAFDNEFSQWFEGSEAQQALLAQQARKEASSPTALANHPTLTSRGYTFEKDADGNYIATKQGADGKQYFAEESGYINTDFTSPGYKSGWIIGPQGKVIQISDFTNTEANRDYLEMTGWEKAIKAAKDSLQEMYPSIFDFKNTFTSDYFGENVEHGDKTFVDLSYYFPGTGYVLGVQKAGDSDNFAGYNWNEEDREFYVSKDGSSWQVVKGIANVQTALGVNSGFNYKGADAQADEKKNNYSQYITSKVILRKPADWDLIKDFTVSPSLLFQGGQTHEQFIKDLITLLIPSTSKEELNKRYIKVGDQKYNNLTPEEVLSYYFNFLENQTQDEGSAKQFYKWLFNEANSILGVTDAELAAILYKYHHASDPYDQIYPQGNKSDKNVDSNKMGGVLKLADGGLPWYVQEMQNSANSSSVEPTQETSNTSENSTYYVDLANRAEQLGRSLAGQKKGEGEFQLDASMKLRLGALLADVTGLVASFVPGYGTAAAGAAGAISFGADLVADSMDDSVTRREMISNAAVNLGMGVVGLIPGGKAWKVTKSLIAYTPALIQLGALTPDLVQKIQKVKEGTYSLTYDDWKQIAAVTSTVLGGVSNIASASKLQIMKNRSKGEITPSTTSSVKAGDGKDYKFTEQDLASIHEKGMKEGQEAALNKVKEILKQQTNGDAEANAAIDNIQLGVNYAQKTWKPFTNFTQKSAKKSIYDISTKDAPVKTESQVDEFYKDNPYRKGNPYGAWRHDENSWSLFPHDYALAHGYRPNSLPIKKLAEKLSFDFSVLGKLRDVTQGPGYAKRHMKMAKVQIDGKTVKRHIPKENKLVTVKNGKQKELVELRPTENKNEWVNVQDKNDIYTKRANGTFVKKVEVAANTNTNVQAPASPTPAPPVQTSNSASISSDGTVQKSTKSSKRANANAEKKKGTKNALGGKLDRLTNYLNSK